jgi:hypothetical protein
MISTNNNGKFRSSAMAGLVAKKIIMGEKYFFNRQ